MRAKILIPFLLLAACSADLGDRDPETFVQAGKSPKPDSHQKPTDHGEIDLGTTVNEKLTDLHGFHTWEFTTYDQAKLTLRTGPQTSNGAAVDTVVYLYREGATGWGSYIGKNDDANKNTVWSKLDKTVDAGHYRALVKGYAKSDLGKFALHVDCAGQGCAPPAPVLDTSTCLFGTTYHDLDEPRTDLVVVNREKLYAGTPLTALDQQQVVLAVQQSSHDDVTTAAEAFAAVDEGEINRTFVWEPAARRTFVAYEYGAGDNSYGAFFHRESTELAAAIHDGDLYQCSVLAETCLLGDEYHALLADPAFAGVSSRVVTAADQLVGVDAEAAFAAVKRIHPEVTDLAGAIAAADDGRLNLTGLFHTATQTEFLVVELGAGDTSVGTVFFARSTQPAAFIEDGGFDACGFFAARGGAQQGADCRGANDCGAGLTCVGVFAGAGKCVPTTHLPGEGQTCASDADCGTPQLVCSGFTHGGGLCNPAWTRGSFGEVVDLGIPDGGTLVRHLAAYGLATVDTDVELRATILHEAGSQLRVTLTNPVGTEVEVFDGAGRDDSDPYVIVEGAVTGFSGDESVNGEWTLRVTDRTTGVAGKVIRWDLTVSSRWD